MNTGKIIRAAALGVLSAGAVTGIVIGNSIYKANAEAIKTVLVPTTYRVVDDGKSSTPTKVKSGHALAEQVEEEGAVLLQNKKGTLPLSKAAANNNIAILGFGAASGLLRQGWMLGPGWPGGVGSPVRAPGGRLGLLDGPAVPGAGATGKMPPSRRVRQGWGRPVARRPAVRQPDPRRPARPGACQAGAWTGSESSAAEGQAGHGRARRFLPKRLLKRLL